MLKIPTELFMKHILPRLSLIAFLFVSSSPFLQAQLPGGGSTPMNSAMLKMFGKNTNFTAKAEVRMLDDSKNETMSLSFTMALHSGKMRAEMDMVCGLTACSAEGSNNGRFKPIDVSILG